MIIGSNILNCETRILTNYNSFVTILKTSRYKNSINQNLPVYSTIHPKMCTSFSLKSTKHCMLHVNATFLQILCKWPRVPTCFIKPSIVIAISVKTQSFYLLLISLKLKYNMKILESSCKKIISSITEETINQITKYI